jgi:peptidase E
MKLLLTSSSLVHGPRLIDALHTLLLPRAGPWRICHIVTASLAGRPAADRSWATELWVTDEERHLQAHGFLCQSLDIAGWSGPALAEHLAGYDALYIQGGNTFHLLDQMRRRGPTRSSGSWWLGTARCVAASRREASSPVRRSASPAGAPIGTATRSA